MCGIFDVVLSSVALYIYRVMYMHVCVRACVRARGPVCVYV